MRIQSEGELDFCLGWMNFEIVIDRPHRNAESEKLNKSEVQEKPCAMYI